MGVIRIKVSEDKGIGDLRYLVYSRWFDEVGVRMSRKEFEILDELSSAGVGIAIKKRLVEEGKAVNVMYINVRLSRFRKAGVFGVDGWKMKLPKFSAGDIVEIKTEYRAV